MWSTGRFMALLWVFTHYTLHTLLNFKRWSAPGLWKLLRGSWWKKLFSEHLFQKQKQVCDSHLLGTGTSLFYADSQGNSPRESTQGSFKTFLSFIKQMAKLSMLGHFRVALSLCFKARLWKRLFILVQIKLIFTWKIFHLASFWKREIWNSKMTYCLLQSVSLDPNASLHATTGRAAGNKNISGKDRDAGMLSVLIL